MPAAGFTEFRELSPAPGYALSVHYIEGFCDSHRRHGRLGNLRPATYEMNYHDSVTY